MAFDLTTHIRDKQTGELVKINPYRRHEGKGGIQYERPPGSGVCWDVQGNRVPDDEAAFKPDQDVADKYEKAISKQLGGAAHSYQLDRYKDQAKSAKEKLLEKETELEEIKHRLAALEEAKEKAPAIERKVVAKKKEQAVVNKYSEVAPSFKKSADLKSHLSE